MRNWLMKVALQLIWSVTGKLGQDLARWIEDAKAQGLDGREAFDFVWRTAKVYYRDIDDWLLNLLIEAILGHQFAGTDKLLRKLRWPKGV